MKKFEDGYYDLLLQESDIDSENKNLSLVDTNDDEWFIRQFNNVLLKGLSNFDKPEEKIQFLNELTEKINVNKFSERKLNSVGQDNDFSLPLVKTEFISKNLWNSMVNEFKTCDSVDIVVPFISSESINKIRPILEEFDSLKIRIITTTFDGTSKMLAIDSIKQLCDEFNPRIDVKIENLTNNRAYRIHAKSYFFKRNSGFSSLYIGSGNFTNTGLITGKEFTIKVNEFSEPRIIQNFITEFETIYNGAEMVDIYDEVEVKKIKERQKKIEFQKSKIIVDDENLSTEWKPYYYQQEIIDNVFNRIEENKKRHLIVMATGSGKTPTMVFIYKKLLDYYKKDDLKLMYIAPSEEILDQSIKTFSSILGKPNFGAMFYSGRGKNYVLEDESIIFTNINTMINKIDILEKMDFDVVVFDEAHHIEAKTFKKIFEILAAKAKQTFGLTATPQRTDGVNVRSFFGHEFAGNLSLYDAIDNEILSDFDYHFIIDNVANLEKLDLKKSEDFDLVFKQLSSETRNKFVYKNILKYIGKNRTDVKTVAFCFSREHAIDFSQYLIKMGEKAGYIVSKDAKDKAGLNQNERTKVLEDFKNSEINYLCVVDIFNEGVDISEIDKIIFLRPTNSLLVYIQQLGRGLRKRTDKKLEVFDFVNNVDMNINKGFNPFVAVSELTKNLRMADISKKVESINEYLPGESSFVLTKMVKEDFVWKLKEYEKVNLYKSILDDYRSSGNYDDYEDFFNDKKIDLLKFYESGKVFLKENSDLKNQFKNFALINSEDLVKNFLDILNNKSLTSNEKINNIFMRTYWSDTNKNYKQKSIKHNFESLFDLKNESIIKELIFLLKYKINNQNLLKGKLTNEIKSFNGLYFTRPQIKALFGISINDTDLVADGQLGGVMSVKNTTRRIIVSTFDKQATKFLHTNWYDRKNKLFYWEPPDKCQIDIKNTAEARKKSYDNLDIYCFFADEQVLKYSPNTNIREFIGKVSHIELGENIVKEFKGKLITKPRFIFKIN